MTFPLIKLDCGIFSFSGSPNQFPQIVNVVKSCYIAQISNEWRDLSLCKNGAK